MAHYKNRRPKSVKGCCAMCSGRSHACGLRNKRQPTRQEAAAPRVDDPVTCADCMDRTCRWCAWGDSHDFDCELCYPEGDPRLGPDVVRHTFAPSPRVPVLTRPIVFA